MAVQINKSSNANQQPTFKKYYSSS